MSFKSKTVISGTWGEVWVNGELYAEVNAFQAKMEFAKEEIGIAGRMAKSHKIVGWNGTGSMTIHKIDSKQAKLLKPTYLEGKEVDTTIVVKLADPDALGSERVSLTGVLFDDVTLFDFEVAAVGSVECPFTFDGLDLIETI